jgi:hypothetical protein
MTFYDYEMAGYIDVSLREGNYDNDLSVTGAEKNWVQGTFTNLQEIIESVRPQDNFILKNRGIILHVISIGFGSLVFNIVYSLMSRIIEPIQNPSGFIIEIRNFFKANLWAYYFFEIFLRWGEGLVFAYYIREWLIRLWPKIEFDF